MSYIVTTDLSEVTLSETDPVRSVLQNVAMILGTRQGESPMCRDFGLPQNFLDKPVNAAKVLLLAEIRDAVARYEPRAEVLKVSFSADEEGRLTPVVEVEINVS